VLSALTIFYGVVVGFSLGLTGTGGSMVAVPLLIYGLGLGAHRAVCVSMVAVGAIAAVGTFQKLRTGEVEVASALIVAVGGFLGAPIGAWLSKFFSEKWLLLLFSGVVVIVGLRLLLRDSTPNMRVESGTASGQSRAAPPGAILLIVAGVVIGILAGLLGIGGGFIIVPVLVLFAGIEMTRAITTSLLVIALVSIPAVASHLIAGQRLPPITTALFAIGGVLGLNLGSPLQERLSGLRLQQVFAVAMLVMGALLAVHNLGLL
jgi:uncharacterized membrane protein YfcA